MADPFEVRMRFTHQLQHLNASTTSAQKAASYAIKHNDMDEDLHSCILEQLEKNSMNTRANIFYFIEHLCEAAQKEHQDSFIQMIRRDIYRILDAVAPADGTGAANVKVLRKSLPKLEQLRVLTPDTATELITALKDRDISLTQSSPSPTSNNQTRANTASGLSRSDSINFVNPNKQAFSNGPTRIDKREAAQRMEEDRERGKRLKETTWEVPGEGSVEADRLWEEASDFGEDDGFQGEDETTALLGVPKHETLAARLVRVP